MTWAVVAENSLLPITFDYTSLFEVSGCYYLGNLASKY